MLTRPISFVLIATFVAACAPTFVKPPAAVPSDEATEAAIVPAVKESVSHNIFRTYEFGRGYVVGSSWKVQRGPTGVVLGRSKPADVLAKSPDGNCYVMHFVIIQELVGGAYVDSYSAAPVESEVGGQYQSTHAIDCSDFR